LTICFSPSTDVAGPQGGTVGGSHHHAGLGGKVPMMAVDVVLQRRGS
jgi:hypothetical protein